MFISENDLRSTLLRYITGRSTESERAEFEERLLTDQEFSDDAAVCEQELIDAYALRRLNVADMEGLRAWIEVSPARIQRVKMARTLLLPPTQRFHSQRRITFILAAAACVLLAVTLHLTNRATQKHPTPASQTVATNTQPVHVPAADLAGAIPPNVVLLAVERVRGEQPIAAYDVHRNAPVQLQIMLTSETARSGYKLQVAPLERPSHTLLEKTDMDAQSMNGQLYLDITLPPGSLPPATYTASVSRRGETLVSHFTLKWSQK